MKFLTCFIALVAGLLVLISPGLSAESKSVQIHSIQADFTQEKHLKILARPLISTGTFTFAAPQSLRWEYTTPVPSILLMHGGKIRKYLQRDGELVEDKGMRLDSMQIVLAEISNWLDGRFTENDVFNVSFPDKHTVLLLPKEASFARLINRIELQLADQMGLLDKVTIFEGPDSYTTMSFSNRILNQEIPASVFNTK
jgi:outer membrane lipoprotein-sorting protein